MFIRSVLSSFRAANSFTSLCRYSSSSKSGSLTNVGIVGVPFDKGQRINSCTHMGPKAIRDGGLVEEIKLFNGMINSNRVIQDQFSISIIYIEWVDIKDYGDIKLGEPSHAESPKNMSNYYEVVNTMKNLSDKVYEVLKDKRMCITLGGDHSLGFGKFISTGRSLRF